MGVRSHFRKWSHQTFSWFPAGRDGFHVQQCALKPHTLQRRAFNLRRSQASPSRAVDLLANPRSSHTSLRGLVHEDLAVADVSDKRFAAPGFQPAKQLCQSCEGLGPYEFREGF